MKREKIPIAGDHKAFGLKTVLIKYLSDLGFEPVDLGTYSGDRVDYPVYSLSVADKVSKGEYKRGVVLCYTGIGASIVANKFLGVRCGLVTNAEIAQLTKKHNDTNVLAMGAGYTSFEEAKKILKTWLFTEPEGGRHKVRIDQISAIEKNNMLASKKKEMILSRATGKKDVEISASLMCANQLDILSDVKELIKAGIDSFHIDIIDGLFADNLSMNIDHVFALRRQTQLPINVHLMVKAPLPYLDRLKEAGSDAVIVHLESEGKTSEVLSKIRTQGMQAGLAIKVDSPLEKAYPLVDKLDLVMFMCTPIGFKGQSFIPEVIEKIKSFHRYVKDNKLDIKIMVDGSIGPRTIPHLYKAGARIFLGGTSGLFKDGTFKENLRQMRSFCY
jgi:ribulose-phosphate 3-epimerase